MLFGEARLLKEILHTVFGGVELTRATVSKSALYKWAEENVATFAVHTSMRDTKHAIWVCPVDDLPMMYFGLSKMAF